MERARRYKKILRRIFIGAALLVLFLAIFVVLAPRLINLESVRTRIISEVSDKIGGEIDFKEIRLSLLPLPQAVVYQGRLSIPGKINGALESVSVFPKIWPLFTGDIQLSRISIQQPVFNLIVPEKEKRKKAAVKTFSAKDVEEKMVPIVGLLTSIGDDLEVVVKKGGLNIVLGGNADFRFKDIGIRLDLPGDELHLDLSAASDLCKKVGFKGRINLRTFDARGNIDLSELNPERPAAYLIPDQIGKLGPSKVNLSLRFETNGLDQVKGELQSSLLHLALRRGKQEVVLKGKGLKSAFQKNKNKFLISLEGLSLDNPSLKLSGKFLVDQAGSKAELKLSGRDVDVGSARRSALALAGDISTVNILFDILKKGTVPAVDFAIAGKSLGDFKDLENMTVKGNILKGEVLIPKVDLKVDDIKGNVDISKDTLEVKNITARYGNSRVKDGEFRLGLSGKSAPFQLDVGLTGDLGQVPGVLNRVIDDPAVLAEINRISDISGRAEGRLILGERLNAIKVAVSVDDFSARAMVRPLPGFLEVKGGGFSYAGKSMEIRTLSGKMKNANLSLSSVRLSWHKTPTMGVGSGKGSINLRELHVWLASIKGLAQPLKRLQDLDGIVNISRLKLDGPLGKPLKWNFDLTGGMTGLTLKSNLLPEPLSIISGKFRLNPKAFAIADVEAKSMDAELKLTGRFDEYLEGVKGLDVNFNGRIGERANRWLLKLVKLPPHLLIRPPLKVSKGHFTWSRAGRTTISGEVDLPYDLTLSADVLFEPRRIYVKKLFVQDESSRALLALNLHQNQINLNFRGNLQKATVDKLLADNQILNGWIKGDLRFNYFRERPLETLFEGNLGGKDLVLFRHLAMPLKVDGFSLVGLKDKLQLESDIRLMTDKRLSLKGDVNYSAQGVLFDMALISDGIELDQLLIRLKQKEKKEKKTKKEKFWQIPLAGRLKLDSAYLRYKEYEVCPFGADITLHPEEITLAVRDSNLCGISTPGTLTVLPREVQLDFNPVAQNQEFQSALACLIDEEAKIEGRFNLSGRISGQGPAEELKESLQGNFELNASQGRILAGRSYRTLREILALINVTEVYRGKLPNLTQEGFRYNAIRVKGSVEKDTLRITEGVVDGLTMNIAGSGTIGLANKDLDMKVLVAPLKTVDSIVSKIPLVGYILGGTLITVPVRIRGNIEQPKVSLLSPAAVGSGLVGIMKRTLELPIKIMEPTAKDGKPPSDKP